MIEVRVDREWSWGWERESQLELHMQRVLVISLPPEVFLLA